MLVQPCDDAKMLVVFGFSYRSKNTRRLALTRQDSHGVQPECNPPVRVLAFWQSEHYS